MATIQAFLDELRTPATKSTYRAGIYSFLDWKYGRVRADRKVSPKEGRRYEELAARYLKARGNYAEDLRKYAASMQNLPPKTAGIRMTGIKEFFVFNNLDLSEKDLRQIRKRMPQGGARTIEKDLDHNALQTILMHADIKEKALILSLASSGMRIGEVLQLRISDVNLDAEPAIVMIRQEITKTRRQRITFLSREAVAALKEWLKIRPAYLESAKNRNAGLIKWGIGGPKSKEDLRIFPFAGHVAQAAWRTTVGNAGLSSYDESTGRHQLHYHQLRKFFRSQLALACPADIVEALMGHEGYLTQAYRRYTREQMAEFYQKAEGLVTIHVSTKDISRLETEVKKEMRNQQEVIAALSVQNQQMRSELKEYQERQNAILQKFIKDPNGKWWKD
ncbi:MAG: site-specific tyrosine recombinase XerD [Methanoregula sp. PtaU1.Bin051]|nr:MAG: site-specific tyrosine recombinase XerD [Methanoregula sp. PtaU1.Bin051]